MSRDAKVGLVIVFAFVFLLGTILVHRFHLTDLGQLAAGNDTAVVGPDASPAIGDSLPDENPLASSNSGAVTTVNALPEENLNQSLTGGRTTVPFDSSFPRSQQSTGQSVSSRPPVEVPETSDSGAHISLTDPRDDQQGAAVVESRGSTKNSRGHDTITGQSAETEMPGARQDSHHRSPSLLEINQRSPGAGRTTRDRPVSEDEAPSTTGEVTSLDSNEPTADVPAEVTEPRDSETESFAGTQSGRRVPPLNRPPTSAPEDDPAEMNTGPDSIQQAADKRRPEPEVTSPPKLPKYGDPPQAIIESVPDRDSRAAPRAADRSNDAVEPFSPPVRTAPRSGQSDDHQIAGQKPYVVKEGDSFWSISAKQYGTGKYFRALEQYNFDRLVTPGGEPRKGERQLVPGITIILPDVAVLQSNSSRKKPSEPAASKPARNDPWKEDTSAEPLTKRDTASVPKRETASPPGTYRVKEGDTLSTIALRELGTSKRWQEIFQLNRRELDDPQGLKAGMVLKMPPASTAEKAAGRPNF